MLHPAEGSTIGGGHQSSMHPVRNRASGARGPTGQTTRGGGATPTANRFAAGKSIAAPPASLSKPPRVRPAASGSPGKAAAPKAQPQTAKRPSRPAGRAAAPPSPAAKPDDRPAKSPSQPRPADPQRQAKLLWSGLLALTLLGNLLMIALLGWMLIGGDGGSPTALAGVDETETFDVEDAPPESPPVDESPAADEPSAADEPPAGPAESAGPRSVADVLSDPSAVGLPDAGEDSDSDAPAEPFDFGGSPPPPANLKTLPGFETVNVASIAASVPPGSEGPTMPTDWQYKTRRSAATGAIYVVGIGEFNQPEPFVESVMLRAGKYLMADGYPSAKVTRGGVEGLTGRSYDGLLWGAMRMEVFHRGEEILVFACSNPTPQDTAAAELLANEQHTFFESISP